MMTDIQNEMLSRVAAALALRGVRASVEFPAHVFIPDATTAWGVGGWAFGVDGAPLWSGNTVDSVRGLSLPFPADHESDGADIAEAIKRALANERITIVEGGEWTCLCGNTAAVDGFLPCDFEGHEAEDPSSDWNGRTFLCGACNRIIAEDGLIIGQASAPEQLEELTRVQALVDFPDHGVIAGQLGTIVHVYPERGYEVEFAERRETPAVVTVAAGQVTGAMVATPIAIADSIKKAMAAAQEALELIERGMATADRETRNTWRCVIIPVLKPVANLGERPSVNGTSRRRVSRGRGKRKGNRRR